MKKIVSLAFVSLLLLLSMLMLGSRLVTTASGSTTYDVDSGESIQDAINSAQPGDTIFVHNGTYIENVVVNKTVSLIGEDKYNTIIDGNRTGNVIAITADNVNITGFTIQNSGWTTTGSGVYVIGSSDNNISCNIITNNVYGIWIEGFGNNTLNGNNVSNNFFSGILVYYSSNNTLNGNNASNNESGIYLYESSNNTLTGNAVSSNDEYGIHVRYSDNNTLTGNTVSNNVYGIRLHVSGGNVLSGNTALNNSYNFVVFGHTFSVLDNHVDKSNMVDGKPIYYLKGVTDTIYDAQTNVGTFYLINCTNITIKDLTLTKNGHGLFLWNTTNSKIEKVTASNNRWGIYLYKSSNNTVTSNTLSSNGEDGIQICYSDNNTLNGNTASNNGYGIYLIQSGNNTITGNMVSNNQDGVYLSFSGDNTLFHNNFIRNTNQAYVTSGHTNIWDDDYPSGGNYWSDYPGVDEFSGPYQNVTGSDGIGDTPYVIDDLNQDNYPLYFTPVHNIDSKLNYMTIQKAIDANETLSGHTILVDAGTYYEHLTIDKSLKLRGENKDNTIIDGDGSGTVISTSNIGNVTISNFTIQNGATGVSISHSNNIVLKNNNITGNSYNFGVTGDEHENFVHDIDTSNTVDGKPIYYLVNQQNTEIPFDAGYVALVDCTNVTIRDLTLTNNIQGILFRDTKESTIMNVTIRKMHSEGIWLYYSSSNNVYDNTISNVGDDGIWLYYSSSNNVCDNRISNVNDGIYVSAMAPKSRNNYLSGNVVLNCSRYSLYLINADSNDIIGNTLLYTGMWASIRLDGSYNTLYHNNIDGRVSMHSLMKGNRFDNGVEGNYWSNYDGTDVDQDGIGDSPHQVVENNQDNYPLMGPFSDFSVDYEEETYHVTTVCNSTISAFQCDYVNNMIRFNVTGEDETFGFCRVCIPHAFMYEPYNVTIDGANPVFCNYTLYDNGTHRWIYFVYQHSTHEVIIQGSETVPPTISILSPENKTYPSNEVSLTFTVDEPIDWMGYSLDGQANVTITGNTTLSGLSDGSHSLIVYAKDTAGNTGASEIIYFSIKTQQAEPFQTWIVAAIVIIAIVGTAFLVYFAKVKKTTEKVK